MIQERSKETPMTDSINQDDLRQLQQSLHLRRRQLALQRDAQLGGKSRA